MKTIKKLESQLAVLRSELSRTTDPEIKGDLEEKIDFIQDDIDELESDLRDQQDYEEATGTTPQDLYNERNSYTIAQSERYDQFRNEY